MGPSSRRLLNHLAQSNQTNSTSSIVFQGPRVRMSSVVYRPLIVSAVALSEESPRQSTDDFMPASAGLASCQSGIVLRQRQPSRRTEVHWR